MKYILARFTQRPLVALTVAAILIVALAGLFIGMHPLIAGALMASTTPAFASVPPSNFTPQTITTANTALDGTGANVLLVATAPAAAAPAGSFVERIRVMHLGTNVATVMRVFLNNGSTPGTAGNNALIAEKTIPANTLSQVAESVPQDIIINQILKGHATTPERIYVSIGTSVAAGLKATAIGGDL